MGGFDGVVVAWVRVLIIECSLVLDCFRLMFY